MPDKEWAINGEKCRQKDERLYFVVCSAIDNHSPIRVHAALQTNSSDNTFVCSNFIQNVILHNIVLDDIDKEYCCFNLGGIHVECRLVRGMEDPILLV